MEHATSSALSRKISSEAADGTRGVDLPRRDEGRLAFHWFFRGRGAGHRLAAFACHVSLLTAFGGLLITVLTMGSFMLGVVAHVHTASPLPIRGSEGALSADSALQIISVVDSVLRGGIASNFGIAFVLALCFETYWTVRRAPRMMPPVEYLASDIYESCSQTASNVQAFDA